jgi:hypothetical protein
MNSVSSMANGEAEGGDRLSVPDVDSYHVTAEDAGVSADFEHADPLHLKVAQKAVYGAGSYFVVCSLRRENESGLDELVSVFYLSSSDHTCVVLARTGADTDVGGRAFLILQYPQLLEEIPNLVGQGFEVQQVNGNNLSEDLPEHLVPEE